MARRHRHWQVLQTAKREALLAVDLYNRPFAHRYLEAHIVHMHLAWLYLAQAIFSRDGVDFRYRHADGRHFKRAPDGDILVWDLARSLAHVFPDANDPVRRNVEFFIQLRNKIEHRHAEVIEAVVAGKIQSNVLNFENKVTEQFGAAEGLSQILRLPIFLSSLTSDATQAIKRAHQLLPVKVRNFIRTYEEEIPEEIRSHPNYELRLYLMPKTSARTDADAAIEFVRATDLTDEQKKALDRAQVIVRDKVVEVSNRNRHKPKAVAAVVENRIPFVFRAATHHVRAWQHFHVRPATGAKDPKTTDPRYCVWDEAHQDYVYFDAWIEKLANELQTAQAFESIIGLKPTPKKT